ncbi:FMN-dependent NADH-azoreductase [Methylacidiphilum kamchatkense Kam1]|uniref:FMN dependent NADH:quinone oxidoreductase n=2 Tax=Methylacidiphilum kamchatkense Kam1 TaxID=1202785 RepID=A0ABR4ZX65_9BACT|nr:NAD(P)H-dependent oxidoreductase [Methylacidiphilum kamchatkense]KIE58827.1 FMN-dependent NADH-azoreductase [Methylacidiphilum kamchatkense Kam1]
MAKILYIEASPRKDRSFSIATAKVFLEAYKANHSTDSITTLDLWSKSLPSFDGYILQSKYAIFHGLEHTPEQKKAWSEVEAIIAHFISFDKYVFSFPMWNFAIPYRLKHYIDILVQPTYTFSYTPQEGYKGLVVGKKACLICSRGGSYPEGTEFQKYDFQLPYMKLILGFIGITDVHQIIIDGTLFEKREVLLDKAMIEARNAAATF